MLDFNLTEMAVVMVVALLVIGPKDLPKAMRFIGHWVGRARSVARQFRSGFDSMVREAELEEMEKRWAGENERILREHPATEIESADSAEGEPVMVEQPAVVPVPVESPAESGDAPGSVSGDVSGDRSVS